jgi:N-acetylmuramoyl-L-alanine amidase
LFLFHTTEGAGGGEALIALMERNGDRSYHYLVDNDPDGNTIYDLVDTDRASWSVLDANASINLVIGASFAAWSRQEWIDNACDGLHRNRGAA